ncbi:MAG: GDSL-type esterase/lipase family protein [Bacteroidota bacterium]|nr:GDSL-type esterase/lipase family protein [Bacteroidota bacterium]
MKYRVQIYFLLISFLTAISGFGFSQSSDQKIRVACIGDSVTKGLGLGNPESQSYPAQLQALLGSSYQVENFGVSGTTLLSKGHRPYILTDEYQRALDFKPQLVIIHLGLNDTDPRNWPNFRDDFIEDYLKIIRSFQISDGQSPKVFICRMTPIFNAHPRFKSGTRDWFWQIQQEIEQFAKAANVGLIDLHTPLYSHPDLFKDALHPDQSGAAIIAKTVFQHITGNFGGLKLAPVFRNHMVFQQKSAIRIWGKANSGSEIVGEFNQQTEKCIANESGDWTLTFDPVPEGGPYTLKVSAGSQQTITVNDILVGDLWICVGQSNMEFPLKDAANASGDISKVGNPNIRLWNMKGIVRPDDAKWDSLSLDKINKLEYFEGTWKSCDPENAADFSAIGYYFGKMLNENLNVPIGIIQVTVGGAPVEAFIDRKTLEFDPSLVDVLYKWKQNDFIMDWCRERAKLNISLSKNELQRHPFEPAYIYEAGIQHLAGLPVSGVIWYQGESNAHNAEHYRNAFPALVKSWRKTFNDPELPFYFAQLSSLNRPSWPYFRDVQRQLSLSVPYSGMVVTSDLGDSLNVHPIRKREVGERFAKLALANVYGHHLVSSGPEVLKFSQTGEQIRIQFNHATQLKTSDNMPLREIEIAGQDGIFKLSKASIEGKEIVIQTQMMEIQKIRYGWNPFSRGSLVNEAGLPASTFKIDKQ